MLSIIDYLRISSKLEIPVQRLVYKALYSKGEVSRCGFRAKDYALPVLVEAVHNHNNHELHSLEKAGVPKDSIKFWIEYDDKDPNLIWCCVQCGVKEDETQSPE